MSKRARGADGDGSSAKRAKATDVETHALAWGQNSLGQVGVGLAKPERKKPALLSLRAADGSAIDGKTVAKVVAGGAHTAVITTDGQVFTFGCNDEGALGRTCVDAGDVSKDDAEGLPMLAEGLDGVRIVAGSAGDSHTFVLSDDGKVYGAGCFRDPSGAFAFSPELLIAKAFVEVYPAADGAYDPVVRIASGDDHVLIMTESAAGKTKVLSYGTADQGQLGRIGPKKCARDAPWREAKGGDPTIVAALAKRRTTLACVQAMLRFRPVSIRSKKKVVDVFAGGSSSGCVHADGTVTGWGLNNYDQLGNGLFKQTKNTLVYTPTPSKAYKDLEVVQAAMGGHHAVVLTKQKAVYTIGRGDKAQLGVAGPTGGMLSESSAPVPVTALAGQDVVAVACGGACTFAVTKAGRGYAWGFGENQQLTSTEEDDIVVPTLMTGRQIDERRLLEVDAGAQHTCAVVADK